MRFIIFLKSVFRRGMRGTWGFPAKLSQQYIDDKRNKKKYKTHKK